MGIHPYAQSFNKQHRIQDIINDYSNKELRDIENIIQNPEPQVSTAGRLMLYRSHVFVARILDSSEQIQLMFHRDQCKILRTEKRLMVACRM